MRGRRSIFALGAALLASCGVRVSDSPDAGPRSDAWVPIDGAVYPDAQRAPDLALQFVDPDHGPFIGGTEVAVRGIGFDTDTRVFFGGRAVEPLDMELVDSRRIIVRTPPGQPGPADVEVREGDLIAALPGEFAYEALYADPASGSTAGGTFITITGLGTDFGPDTSVTIDGVEMTGVTVLNEQALTGFTPPGIAGNADIRVTTATSTYEAEDAFRFDSTGDSSVGGMSGGPIAGTVNVAVLDNNTDDGIPGAYVVIGEPATSAFQGTTDDLGLITFSDPSLRGPITLTAAAPGYETTSFVKFDATNITVFLRRPPPIDDGSGPFPPGPEIGRIYGHVLFGDATGIGSPHWNLVPEPRTPTEVKRVYVTTTSRSPFAGAIGPAGFIDYQYDPSVVAWEYDAYARPSATAVVAIAGLYDTARDPSGTGVSGFEPFAMGIRRGVLVGPGEVVIGQDIVINIPLDATLQVHLDQPPPLETPGWLGPIYYKIRPYIDLGGEGVIFMNKGALPTPPAPEARPNHYIFPTGSDTIVLGRMAPLAGPLADASYGFFVGAYSQADNSPFSVRVVRGVSNVSQPITLDNFMAVPRPVDPAPDSTASRMGLRFETEGPPPAAPTFHMHVLSDADAQPLLRMFTRGDIFDVDLPDLAPAGLPKFPRDTDISWTLWRIQVPGATFDAFNYRYLSALYWDSYAADAFWVRFPTE